MSSDMDIDKAVEVVVAFRLAEEKLLESYRETLGDRYGEFETKLAAKTTKESLPFFGRILGVKRTGR